MPRKNFELTWFQPAGAKGRWKKRYQGKTYYLKTDCRGKRDVAGYQAALREWERVKAWADGLAPCPYTEETGALIPEEQMVTRRLPTYLPPAKPVAAVPVAAAPVAAIATSEPSRSVQAGDPDWMIGRGIEWDDDDPLPVPYTSKDGVLILDEYRAGLTNRANAETRFKNFDQDGDGKLTRQEFVGPAPK